MQHGCGHGKENIHCAFTGPTAASSTLSTPYQHTIHGYQMRLHATEQNTTKLSQEHMQTLDSAWSMCIWAGVRKYSSVR